MLKYLLSFCIFLGFATKIEPERSPEAVFVLEIKPNVELVQVCEPETASIIEVLLEEFVVIAALYTLLLLRYINNAG